VITRRKLLDRKVGHRDARLFVIAVEGEKTEARYFAALEERAVVHPSRVKLHVLPASEGRSAPSHVLERLDGAARELRLQDFDETWLVIDRDRWTDKMLAEVATGARQREHQLAVSNPCFELWLLLHVSDAGEAGTCDEYAGRFRAAVGGWSKTGPMPERLDAAAVRAAITRADALDDGASDGWPQAIGTHVHRLVRRLLEIAPGADQPR
jgi:hypothetical protein